MTERMHPQDLRAIMATMIECAERITTRKPGSWSFPEAPIIDADEIMAELERTARPESREPKPGDRVRVTETTAWYRNGDLATIKRRSSSGWWCDFNGHGNDHVNGGGVWSVDESWMEPITDTQEFFSDPMKVARIREEREANIAEAARREERERCIKALIEGVRCYSEGYIRRLLEPKP